MLSGVVGSAIPEGMFDRVTGVPDKKVPELTQPRSPDIRLQRRRIDHGDETAVSIGDTM